jgi:hypothetical protein
MAAIRCSPERLCEDPAMAEPYSELREDLTDVTTATLVHGRWRQGHGQARRTVHRRALTPHGVWNIDSADHDPGRERQRQEVIDVENALACIAAAAGSGARLTTRVELCQGTRIYQNSLGQAFRVASAQWTVAIQRPDGQSLQRIIGNADELGTMAGRLAAEVSKAQNLNLHSAPPPLSTSTEIILESSVAGVLLHELIGHALEEHDIQQGSRVLPHDLDIDVEAPQDRDVDDEGVGLATPNLVRAGVVTITPRARDLAGVDRPATGHAWASWHQPAPRVRLAHLRATPVAASDNAALPERYIRCKSVAGARYFRGYAALDVTSADLVTEGTALPLRPFRVVITDHHLQEHTRVIGPVDTQGGCDPAAVSLCVKNGDALPSSVTSPVLSISKVPPWTTS